MSVNKTFSALGGAIVYLYKSIIDVILLMLPLFYNYGIEESSFAESALIYMLTVISGVLTVFILKRSTLKAFAWSFMAFLLSYLILYFICECTGVRYIVHLWITGYEDYGMSESYLTQDVWFYHRAACLIGVIVAGIITYLRQNNIISAKPSKIERIESDGAS